MKIRNVSGEDRHVPELNRTVKADQVVDVPDARADGYTCQPDTWKAVTAPTTPKKTQEKE